jgi:hypothetical protein
VAAATVAAQLLTINLPLLAAVAALAAHPLNFIQPLLCLGLNLLQLVVLAVLHHLDLLLSALFRQLVVRLE